ncbi:MAG TPA: hypothetical protein VEK07_08215 [Polyangiaceae bacterium]|nr:hypothetical protein [Polyangiaceae bacterium]
MSVIAAVLFAASSGCGSAPPGTVINASPGSGAQDAAAGAIAVDASIDLVFQNGSSCPGISSFSIDPASIAPGQSSLLAIATVGPPASIQWTVSPASAGMFSSPTSAQTTFLCASPGLVTITVQVELTAPDAGDACAGVLYTSYAAMVGCEK